MTAATTAAALTDPAPPLPSPPPAPQAPTEPPLGIVGPMGLTVMPLGYVEAYYEWNFNRPSNGITSYRGFDDRHNTFTLSNVALGTGWSIGPVYGKIVFQVGSTSDSYYLSEPSVPGYPAGGVADSNASAWKYIQEAYVGYKASAGNGLSLQMGLFLSPIGPESLAIKDSWNWSRSNLFFGLPFYHTGVRVRYKWDSHWATVVSGYNGWNSVVDDNSPKSVEVDTRYKNGPVNLDVLYFGGVERPTADPTGQPWRSDFEANAQLDVTRVLALLAELNGGFESNRFGISDWMAGAVYARATATGWLSFAARADFFREMVPTSKMGSANPIFWPVPWVSSITLTVDVHPTSFFSGRVEYRHDEADGPMYFAGTVVGNGTTAPFVPNARRQDTLTFGTTAWFQ